MRFELGAYALKPGVKVIAPWREWDLNSREKLMAYCQQHDIPVDFSSQKKKSPYSMDANLLHISYEGGNLEDPWVEAEEDMWRWSVSPEAAPDKPTYVELTFERGDIVAIDGEPMRPHEVLSKLNQLGGDNGIGRLDIVENRYVGMKSRGCYETPGHHHAAGPPCHRVAHPRPRRGPSQGRADAQVRRGDLQRLLVEPGASCPAGRHRRDSEARLRRGAHEALQGNATVAGRRSDASLFDESIATFEDDAGAYDQKDAEGFIKLNALRLRIAAGKGRQQD